MRTIYIILIIWAGLSMAAVAQQRVSLKFVDAPLLEVIKTLSESAGINLTVSGSAAEIAGKKITMQLNDVSYRQALFMALSAYGIKHKAENSAVIVSLMPSDLSASAFEKTVACVGLKNIAADRAKKILESVYPEVKIEKSIKSSGLIIYADPRQQQKLSEMLASIDNPMDKILIEAKVVETASSNVEKIGTSLNNDQGGLKFNINKDDGKFEPAADFVLYINLLVSKGQAEILAQPKVAVLDGEEANINIGSKIPYAVPSNTSSGNVLWSVQYIDAGVSLKIIPRRLDNNLIEVSLKPEVSAVSEWKATNAGEFPVISTRNVETQVTVEDGQTLVIAGLASKNDYKVNSKIPLLGDIPIAGRLFQYNSTETSKTEIIFLITPKIV